MGSDSEAFTGATFEQAIEGGGSGPTCCYYIAIAASGRMAKSVHLTIFHSSCLHMGRRCAGRGMLQYSDWTLEEADIGDVEGATVNFHTFQTGLPAS